MSRKVGNAVVRNRVKRMIREFFRHRAAQLPSSRTVVIARPGAAGLDSGAAVAELERLFSGVGVRS